jgi:hypothetical protein
MGRLTLNVLLSFAQFERELVGERVRDKIAASKRKGIWVGGPVPLGYAAVDKKIVVVAAEAAAVRTIFARYLELGSVRLLAEDLDRRGIRSKPRRLSTGRTIGGGRFGVGALAHLLKNRFYIGEVVYRGEVHRGEHEPILDSPLFEAVQAKLAAQARARRCRLRGSPALLSGRLFDDRGNRMSPTHTNKGGARYRYYVSQAVLQRKPLAAGAIGRVPAAEIEALISAALRSHLQANGIDALGGDRELVERHVERVTLSRKHIQLQLRQVGDAAVQTDADEDASRRDRRPGRKGGAPHPAVGATRIPLTPDRIGTARGHRTGRPDHHRACSRAALVVGRAGAAPWAALNAGVHVLTNA